MMQAVRWALKRWALFTVFCLAFGLPYYGPLMPALEGAVLPVTSRIAFVDVRHEDGDILARFAYVKRRLCEYINTTAYQNGEAVSFKSEIPGASTRLLGYQISGLWRLKSSTLEGLEVYFIHRCSPYWITVTKAYG